MSERLRSFAQTIVKKRENDDSAKEVIEVSAPASTAASLYEKVRTAVDYQEEHLLRRNAILRILKRFLGSDVPIEKMAYSLLEELIWAKYLPNKEVPMDFANELVPIFMKYEPLLRRIDEAHLKKDEAFSWVLDVMSTEIEYAITPPVAEEAMVSYMYEEIRERAFWDPKLVLSEEDKDLRLYIAIHKVLLKSNLATLRFRVLTLYYPNWPGAATPELIEEISSNLNFVIELIEGQVFNPVTEKLSVLLRRKTGVFRVIRDIVEENEGDIDRFLQDPELLDREVAKTLKRRTREYRKKMRRTIVRSVIFLFLTKMLFALLVELPYDLWIGHVTNFLPVIINIIFPPIFLALIAATTTIPERKNINDYISCVRALVVGADHQLLNIRVKRNVFTAWGKIFTIVYTLMFVFSYGILAVFLTTVDFNWIGVLTFLFFLSLVTFFGIRIRGASKDIVVSPSNRGLFGTMFDAFVLPIVRAGRWLSLKVAKVNVFIYFFDFIIESPYKVAVRFLEGWVAFIREKKEEI